MELQIGNNIKNLRRQRGMTQEELARRLNITAAAVSKWENMDSYPDISVLIPIAEVFGVTLDALMGYDLEREELEVTKKLKDYNHLTVSGKFKEASELIAVAYENRPNNYRLIRTYMKDIAKSGVSNPRIDELKRLAGCILDGCQDEQTRLDALFVKAQSNMQRADMKRHFELRRAFPNAHRSTLSRRHSCCPRNHLKDRFMKEKRRPGLRKSLLCITQSPSFRTKKSRLMSGSEGVKN